MRIPMNGRGSLKDMRIYPRRRHVRQVGTRTPVEDIYAVEDMYARCGHVRQVKTCIPGEDK